AGTGRSRAQDDLAGAEATVKVMMQRTTFAQRNADHLTLRGIGRLADRLRHFARLARTVADAALGVADDDECRKREATTTLHNLGDAVDVDELVDELVVTIAVTAAFASAAFASAAFAVAVTAATGTLAAPGALAAFGSSLRCPCHDVFP